MKFFLVFLLLLGGSFLQAQVNFNLDLISHVAHGEQGNDVWGYVHTDGVEYALVGTRQHVRIYSLADKYNPREVAAIPGQATTWRDIKSWKDHVYVTADDVTEGLMIIDLSDVHNDNVSHHFLTPNISTDFGVRQLDECHNLFIDENGFCYLAGCGNGMNKAIILDLNIDKWNPPVVGVHGGDWTAYAHDVMVQNNIMYSSEINIGQLSIYDVTDKANIVRLGSTSTSFNFTHNAWVSDDGQYVFTTDERANATVDAYNVSDPTNIRRVDTFKPAETAGQGVIPHNTHYINGFLVTSWYTDGVVITDASRPGNMTKVGSFDTYLGSNGGFNGCWGAYPYLPSGLILATDLSSGLYVLEPQYVRACYLEGMVTKSSDATPINGVTIELLSTSHSTITNGLGDYTLGLSESGSYTVRFSHPLYVTKEVSVDLVNGQLTSLDIQMDIEVMITDVSPDELICSGDIIALTANVSPSSATVIWTDPQGNVIDPTAVSTAGVYTVTASLGSSSTSESVTITTENCSCSFTLSCPQDIPDFPCVRMSCSAVGQSTSQYCISLATQAEAQAFYNSLPSSSFTIGTGADAVTVNAVYPIGNSMSDMNTVCLQSVDGGACAHKELAESFMLQELSGSMPSISTSTCQSLIISTQVVDNFPISYEIVTTVVDPSDSSNSEQCTQTLTLNSCISMSGNITKNTNPLRDPGSREIKSLSNSIPLPGVQVSLWEDTDGDGVFETDTGQDAVTDASGNVYFNLVPEGSYVMAADPSNFTSGVLTGYVPFGIFTSDPAIGVYSAAEWNNDGVVEVLNLEFISSVLPLRFVNFTADFVELKKLVNLHWHTAGELQNSHFLIERAIDQGAFHVVGKVISEPDDGGTGKYHFVDNEIELSGQYLYRIIQVDQDGLTGYSEVEDVRVNRLTDGTHLTVFPNPSNGVIFIRIKTSAASSHLLRVYNDMGQEVMAATPIDNTDEASELHELDLSHLPDGIYTAMLQTDGKTVHERIFVSK